MSTGQEGLGDHTRGPATPEHEVSLPSAREKALKMKASTPRRLKDEDLHAEKASKTKTFASSKLEDEDLHTEKA
jgi:hypothetical protein